MVESRLVVAEGSPDEIAGLQLELGRARGELAAMEAKWANLCGLLLQFRSTYWAVVGELAVGLAETEAQLERMKFRECPVPDPSRPDARSEGISSAATDAEEIRSEYESWASSSPPAGAEDKALTPEVERELRQLWITAARRFHPDFADEPADRERRTELMKEANRLHEAQDVEGLRRLVDSAEPSAAPGRTSQLEGLRADIRDTWRAHDRFSALIQELNASAWAHLKEEQDELESQGFDFWQVLRDRMTQRLEQLQVELSERG